MAPKAKKGKKKEPELVEPEHDTGWDRAVISGVWDRPITALPDANTWPTWGALRERVLAACREIRVTRSPSVRDAFTQELFQLSPPLLKTLDLSGAVHLRRLELSPVAACPGLETLDLHGCPNLEYLLLQSNSLVALDLSGCAALSKVLVQCPRLNTLQLDGCPALTHCMVWSAELTTLDLAASTRLVQLELQTPALQLGSSRIPQVPDPQVAVKPVHPPIAAMLRANCKEAAVAAADAAAKARQEVRQSSSTIPAVYRPFA